MRVFLKTVMESRQPMSVPVAVLGRGREVKWTHRTLKEQGEGLEALLLDLSRCGLHSGHWV